MSEAKHSAKSRRIVSKPISKLPSDIDDDSQRCSDCGRPADKLVPTRRGSTYRVCLDCWEGERWEG